MGQKARTLLFVCSVATIMAMLFVFNTSWNPIVYSQTYSVQEVVEAPNPGLVTVCQASEILDIGGRENIVVSEGSTIPTYAYQFRADGVYNLLSSIDGASNILNANGSIPASGEYNPREVGSINSSQRLVGTTFAEGIEVRNYYLYTIDGNRVYQINIYVNNTLINDQLMYVVCGSRVTAVYQGR